MMIVCPWGVVRVAEVRLTVGKDVSVASSSWRAGTKLEVTCDESRIALCRASASLRPGQPLAILVIEIISYQCIYYRPIRTHNFSLSYGILLQIHHISDCHIPYPGARKLDMVEMLTRSLQENVGEQPGL